MNLLVYYTYGVTARIQIATEFDKPQRFPFQFNDLSPGELIFNGQANPGVRTSGTLFRQGGQD